MRVLITGATGFIAYNLVKELLNDRDENGNVLTIRVTVRDLDSQKTSALRELSSSEGQELEFVVADLLKEDGWEVAVKDCDVVYHLASPFIINVSHPDELIKPAVTGAYYVMRAITKETTVKTVVFTSSIISIVAGHEKSRYKGMSNYSSDKLVHMHRVDTGSTEASGVSSMDRSELSKLPLFKHDEQSVLGNIDYYDLSKALAEAVAWLFFRKQAAVCAARATSPFSLAAICPGYVFGSPHKIHKDAEVSVVIKGIMEGRYPLTPDVSVPHVDLRDVIAVEIAASKLNDGVSNVNPQTMFNTQSMNDLVNKYLRSVDSETITTLLDSSPSTTSSVNAMANRFILVDTENGNMPMVWENKTLNDYFVKDKPYIDANGRILVDKWSQLSQSRGISLQNKPNIKLGVMGSAFKPIMYLSSLVIPELVQAIPKVNRHTYADNTATVQRFNHTFRNSGVALIEHAIKLIENEQL